MRSTARRGDARPPTAGTAPSTRRWPWSRPSATPSRCSACPSCRAGSVSARAPSTASSPRSSPTASSSRRGTSATGSASRCTTSGSRWRRASSCASSSTRRSNGCATRTARPRTSRCSRATDVVYVDRLESPQMLRVLTRVGRRRAAHATSSGQVPARVRQAGGPRRRRRSRLPAARTTDDHLEVDAREGARRQCGERAMRSASRRPPRTSRRWPHRSSTVSGECVAAVSVAGPITRMPPGAARQARAHRARRRGERLVDERRPVSVTTPQPRVLRRENRQISTADATENGGGGGVGVERPVSVSGGGGRTRPCRWRRRASSPPLAAPRGASPRARRRRASSGRPSRSRR